MGEALERISMTVDPHAQNAEEGESAEQAKRVFDDMKKGLLYALGDATSENDYFGTYTWDSWHYGMPITVELDAGAFLLEARGAEEAEETAYASDNITLTVTKRPAGLRR